jgi:hypothetical protein
MIADLAERLAESSAYILIVFGIVNAVILFIFVPKTTIDLWQLLNLFIAIYILILQYIFTVVLTNYEHVERTMRDLARDAGVAFHT